MSTTLLCLLVASLAACHAFLVPHQHVNDGKANRFLPDDLDEYPEVRELFNREVRGASERQIRQSLFGKLSYSECLVRAVDRKDCGYVGIDEEQCAARDCCWRDTQLPGVPWCYHSATKTKEECQVETEERADCGFYGIKAHQCTEKGCCWQPSNVNNVPWCYQSKEPTFAGGCGKPAHPPDTHIRIVGGKEAEPNSWPWQVSLQSGGSHFCGGVLIDSSWVVTAAHCRGGLSSGDRSVKLGMHDRTASEPTVVEVGIDEVIEHPNYNTNNMDSDIMLLRLSTPVTFSAEISPVCLPRLGEPYEVGDSCYTTGWGDLASGGYSPDTLYQVMLPLLDLETCNQEGWYNGELTGNMVCAGAEEGGIDSCQGDSGGPLVCYKSKKWQLTGVVSWGHGCARQYKPGLYTNVANFVDWISQHVRH